MRLKTYSDEEIAAAFDNLDANNKGVLEPADMEHLDDLRYEDVCSLVGSDPRQSPGIPRQAFVKAIGDLAERVDFRIYPVAGSLVLAGFSVGIFGPATPLLITQLGITTAQTGMLTTAFGVTKLLGNIPCGVAADKYGRQPVIVFGGACITLGTLAVSVASTLSLYELLLIGRMLNGIGACALLTGSFVVAADVSTPRNRARSMAPIGMGFNVGSAFGPFAAGLLISTIGIEHTFHCSAAVLGVNTIMSYAMVKETKPPLLKSSEGFVEAFTSSVQSWGPLLQSAPLRQATLYQALTWGAFGAGFMTCLPVLLGSAKLGLPASTLGFFYGGIAATNVIAAQPLATLTDKVGKQEAMLGGMSLLGCSLAVLPLCHDVATLSVALGGWAIASTLIFSIPQAIAADHTNAQDRSNALAMVRTLGDVGLVAGGIGASLLGTTCSIETILTVTGSVCVATTGGSIARRFFPQQR